VHRAFQGKILAFLWENIPVFGKGKQPLFGCKIQREKTSLLRGRLLITNDF
jgi:hypothetical protein